MHPFSSVCVPVRRRFLLAARIHFRPYQVSKATTNARRKPSVLFSICSTKVIRKLHTATVRPLSNERRRYDTVVYLVWSGWLARKEGLNLFFIPHSFMSYFYPMNESTICLYASKSLLLSWVFRSFASHTAFTLATTMVPDYHHFRPLLVCHQQHSRISERSNAIPLSRGS